MGVGLRTTLALLGAVAVVLGGCGSGESQDVGRSGSAESQVSPAESQVASIATDDGRLADSPPSGWTLFGVPRADPPLTGWGAGSEALSAYAVSADEIWANAEHAWFRLRAGAWEELGPGSPYCLPIVATDGALWTASEAGALARISSDAGYRVVAQGPVECAGWGAYNRGGSDGSVWVQQDGDVVQYWPDGRHESIGRPQSVDPPPDDYGADFADRICLHGVDPTGTVWVSEFSAADDEECTAGTWHRWDGNLWIAAHKPDPFTSAQEMVVSGDGIGWVLRGVGGYPVTGTEIARYDVAGYAGYPSQYSVAPDGCVWLLGPQVARLPARLPEP